MNRSCFDTKRLIVVVSVCLLAVILYSVVFVSPSYAEGDKVARVPGFVVQTNNGPRLVRGGMRPSVDVSYIQSPKKHMYGSILLVCGFHHSGTTLMRHMLAAGSGTVEHTLDGPVLRHGLVPCKWLGPGTKASRDQGCSWKVGNSLKKIVLRRKPKKPKPLPLIVAKKTGNDFYGFLNVLERTNESPIKTFDNETYVEAQVRWDVAALVYQVRDPLDSVWSVIKREFEVSELDAAFKCSPCALRDHYRWAWYMLREQGLMAVKDEGLRARLLAYGMRELPKPSPAAMARYGAENPHESIEEDEDDAVIDDDKEAGGEEDKGKDAQEEGGSQQALPLPSPAAALTEAEKCAATGRSYWNEFKRKGEKGRRLLNRVQLLQTKESIASLLPAHVVFYEDVVTRPEEIMRGLTDALQARGLPLEYDPVMINMTAKPLKADNLGQRQQVISKEEMERMQLDTPSNINTFNALRLSQVNQPLNTGRLSAWQKENSMDRQVLLARMNLQAARMAGVVEGPVAGPHGIGDGLEYLSGEEIIELSKQAYEKYKRAVREGAPPLACYS